MRRLRLICRSLLHLELIVLLVVRRFVGSRMLRLGLVAPRLRWRKRPLRWRLVAITRHSAILLGLRILLLPCTRRLRRLAPRGHADARLHPLARPGEDRFGIGRRNWSRRLGGSRRRLRRLALQRADRSLEREPQSAQHPRGGAL